MNDNNETNNVTVSANLSRGLSVNGEYRFLPYDAKAPVTESNLRTAKVMYKTPKDGSKRKDNVCLLVAPITTDQILDSVEELLPHIVAMCEQTQDSIAKDLHTSNDVTIPVDSLNMTAIVAKLTESATSGRMNKETITSWFDSNIADTMSVLFANKLGVSEEPTQEDSDKVDRFVTVYRNKYAGLASNTTIYQPQEAEKLLEAIQKCDVADYDLVASKLKEKLTRMSKPVDTIELLGL